MLMMASIQSMTSPQRKAPVCGAGACSGIQFVLVDFVPKRKPQMLDELKPDILEP
jgi:hypothetical protein